MLFVKPCMASIKQNASLCGKTNLHVNSSVDLSVIFALAQPALTVEDVLLPVVVVHDFHLVEEPSWREHRVVVPNANLVDSSQVPSFEAECVSLRKEATKTKRFASVVVETK